MSSYIYRVGIDVFVFDYVRQRFMQYNRKTVLSKVTGLADKALFFLPFREFIDALF